MAPSKRALRKRKVAEMSSEWILDGTHVALTLFKRVDVLVGSLAFYSAVSKAMFKAFRDGTGVKPESKALLVFVFNHKCVACHVCVAAVV